MRIRPAITAIVAMSALSGLSSLAMAAPGDINLQTPVDPSGALLAAMSVDSSEVFVGVQRVAGAPAQVVRQKIGAGTGSPNAPTRLQLPDSWPGIAGIAVGAMTDRVTREIRQFGWAVSSGAPARVLQFEVLPGGRMRATSSPTVLPTAFGPAAAVSLAPNPPNPAVRSLIIGMSETRSVVEVKSDSVTGPRPTADRVILDVPGATLTAVGTAPNGRYVLAAARTDDGQSTVVQRFFLSDGADPVRPNLAPDGDPIALSAPGQSVRSLVASPDPAARTTYAVTGGRFEEAIPVVPGAYPPTISAIDMQARTVRSRSIPQANDMFPATDFAVGGLQITPQGDYLAAAASNGSWPSVVPYALSTDDLSVRTRYLGDYQSAGQVVMDAGGVQAWVPAVYGVYSAEAAPQGWLIPMPIVTPRTLSVKVRGQATSPGSAGGVVQSSLGGVACAPALDCSQQFRKGDVVTVTAYPNPGSVFTGWSGACTGTDDDCTVKMDWDRAVTATFAPASPARLTVAIGASPNGATRVVSTPAGIDCTLFSGVCTASFRKGTAVVLEVSDPDGTVRSWTGPCAGQIDSCAFVATSDAAVSVAVGAIKPPPPAPRPPDPTPTPTPTPDPTPGPPPSPTPDPAAPAPIPQPLPGPNPPDPAPTPTPAGTLAITSLAVSRTSFRPSQGTIVRYRLNASANVRMTFYNRAAPKRIYTYAIRSGRPGADAGQNRVFISGRVKGRSVRSGKWVMRVSAIRNGAATPPVSRQLTLRAN